MVQRLTTFSRAADLGPVPPWAYFKQALLAVHLGDQLAFRKACLNLLNKAETALPDVARLIVRACVLGSPEDPIKDAEYGGIISRVVSIARAPNLPPTTDWERDCLGPALFRSGALGEGLAMLNREKEVKGPAAAYSRIFIALALHATGKERDAKAEAAFVAKEIGSSRVYHWADLLELKVLLNEFRKTAP